MSTIPKQQRAAVCLYCVCMVEGSSCLFDFWKEHPSKENGKMILTMQS